jgi:acetyl-CoA decarbonylase/synthase complex subunit gamma
MALSGLEIYKMLPQTNCKDCGFPTCLAFAMKLAAKQVELEDCPHVSDETKEKLAAAAAPPIRLVELHGGNGKVAVGNETVLFRHEKRFFHKPGLFFHMPASEGPDGLKEKAARIDGYLVDYVGIDLTPDGFAVEADTGDPAEFASAVAAVRSVSKKPIILMAAEADLMRAGLAELEDERPLLHAATEANVEEMGALAKENDAALVVKAETLEGLAGLTKTLVDMEVKDLVLDPSAEGYLTGLEQLTALRRLALKENFRPLGYPVFSFPQAHGEVDEAVLAAQHIAKYAGFIVLKEFVPASAYPLLVLRENIYTDPQKPIQVQPGIYEINDPDPGAPLLVTTNFSITYFSIANELEGSGAPGWLIVADAEGMSVLTAWAAGKFDADVIAKAVKTFGADEKVSHQKLIIPGHVAVLSGELEEELPGWEILVGPREAVDIAGYLKAMWNGSE